MKVLEQPVFDKAMLNRLYRYCWTLCSQESDAFDLLQIGVERCLKSPPGEGSSVFAYTASIIRNAFIDDLRKRQKIPLEELHEDGLPIDYDISSLESLQVNRSELDFIWQHLLPVEREILFLWAVEGYSTAEVATQLDKPRNTVLSIIHRMRKRLNDNGVISLNSEVTETGVIK